MEKVFVYGSLRQGQGNSRYLEGSKFLGLTKTKSPLYSMVSLGPFPGVLLEGDEKIIGEAYEVDPATFKALDRLEGFPDFYNRIEVELESGEKAWMYVLEDPRYLQEDNQVPGADWVRYREERDNG